MSGDYSRKTFKAKQNYSGVLMQQGRVQLDADCNEQQSINFRRQRAQTVDTIGRAVVPMETPDGFKVAFSAAGLNIFPGRMYVDGMLAENHGASPSEFYPVLDEERGYQPVLYNEQPYYPNVETIAPLPDFGSGIAYLDVWQREVTYVKQPDLVEPAIGVDTTTRLQTVWQVKVLEVNNTGDAELSCSDQVTLWDTLIAPSAGRLSTEIVDSEEEDNVCLVPTEGGYRALENRLYRVEVHSGGNFESAKFKWSRHNASIESAVLKISGTELTVAQAQLDAIRRFNIGDWVEVTDNVREFSGVAGEMRQLDDVDYAQNIITLNSSLPVADFPTDANDLPALDRHTRIKRWDHKNNVDQTTGLINISDSPVYLEDGIKISFSVDPSPSLSGEFKVGDYWIFYARSATAKIEILNNAPPRGIHHHYARLAVLNFQDKQQEDCRIHWPPEFGHTSCCTISVGDGETSFGQVNSIQDAVNQLPDIGGKICLLPGRYAEHVTIKGKQNINISGCGERSVIAGREEKEFINTPIIRIENSVNIHIEKLAIDSLQEGVGIFMHRTFKVGLNVERLITALVPGSGFELSEITLGNLIINSGKGSAIHCEKGSHIKILDNTLEMRNESDSAPGIFILARDALVANNYVAVVVSTPERGLEHIEASFANIIARGGIQIGGMSERIKLQNNLIRNGIGDGISLGSMRLVDKDDIVVVKSYVMLVKGQDPCDSCEAPSNKLHGKISRELSVPMISGLRKMPGLSEEEIGKIDSIRDTTEPLTQISAGDLTDIDIVDNQIENMGRNGIAVLGFFDLEESDEFISIENLCIANNHIESCLNSSLPAIVSGMEDDMGYGGIALADVLNLRIHDNDILNNGSNPVDPVCGIYVLHGEGVEICDNRIIDNGKKSNDESQYKTGPRSGIHLVYAIAPSVSISISNKFTNLPRQNGIPAAKIHNNIVSHPLGRALTVNALGPISITDNQFTSRGIIKKDDSSKVSTVAILNLGLSNELYFQLISFSQLVSQKTNLHSLEANFKNSSADSVSFLNSNLDDFKLGRYLANGNVMFTNNQVVLDELDTISNGVVSATRILSMDDISYSNNQCDYSLLGDFIVFPNVLFAPSLRITDNRFKESLAGAIFSVLAFGIMNTTTNNQATHCILSRGFPGLEVVKDNIELLDVITGGNNESICAKFNKMIKA